MAKVKALRGLVAPFTAKKGEVIEVDDAYAKSLIEFGYAEPVVVPAVVKKEVV